jgi:hypothetical protein
MHNHLVEPGVEVRKVTSQVKREHESTNLRAQKMMRGRVEPSAMVKAVPIVVNVIR